jgi:hypothetical protein
MTRAQPKSSPTDEHARLIAQAISKGRPPPFSAAFDQHCESFPREIFAAFAGVARHMPPTGDDEPLAVGYLFVLQRLLEHLRYRAERGFTDTAKLIADFQADVVAQVAAGNVDGSVLALVGGALHQSKIPASPELAAASERLLINPNEDEPLPNDVNAALAGILEACGGDPFVAVGSLIESMYSMPAEARGAVAGALALADNPEARGTALLLLLDADSAVRGAVAAALTQVATSLTPTDLRRLIAIRNWRPENERAAVDAVIRKTRAAGIDCAPWQAGSLDAITATAVDGAAAQGFMLISPVGRKKRISSLLMKDGIADAWSGEPRSPSQIEMILATAAKETPTLAICRSYLDRTVAHQMALGIEKGEAPPFGLLQVAEIIGGADWQPARMPFSETLAGLLAEVPKAMRDSAASASVLRKSNELAELRAIARSWFEDDPQVAQAVQRARGRNRAQLASFLLQSIIGRRRDRWAEIVLRTAQWMREAPPASNPCWRELVIVAKALADGRDMTEIGLMRDIALRTIAALKDERRMREKRAARSD